MQSTTLARIAAAAALLASLPVSAASAATPRRTAAATGEAAYSIAVARICSGALLFEHAHSIGTDAGARAAAADIRRSARRRLDRVAAIPIPPELTRLATRWISLQRRLAESYAANWMRRRRATGAARPPAQRGRLPRALGTFVHAPAPLRRTAEKLELAFNVPDCTGGDPHP